MKIGQRLVLSVLPAVLGVFTVMGLAYWGRYNYGAPRVLVVVALIAAVLSLALAWHNARYVRQRIDRLAAQAAGVAPRAAGHSRDGDEIETIASTVAGLTEAVEWVREEGDRRAQKAEAREAEYAAIVEQVTHRLGTRIEEAALPLHVLLGSPFGSLNENQEEMLGAAQTALDTCNQELRQLRRLLALDQGAERASARPVRVDELLKPVMAIAQARARDAHVTIRMEISDIIPRAVVDPQHVQEALTTALTDAVAHTMPGGEIRVIVRDGSRDHLQIAILHVRSGTESTRSLELRLAERFIAAQSGTLAESPHGVIVEVPAERLEKA